MLIATPTLTYFGDSFGTYNGQMVNSLKQAGEIDQDKLNTTLLSDDVEFSNFEETIKGFVLARLGHPITRVELTPYQIKTCIDEAITKFSFHAPLFTMQYCSFDASAGISNYKLPRFMINNLSYVIYKSTLMSNVGNVGSFENDAMLLYLTNNFQANNFTMGDWYVFQQHFEMMRKIYGRDGSFTVMDNQYIMLTPIPTATPEAVIVEYRAINSNTLAPMYRNWIQKYALAIAKGVLGSIRDKFDSVPGPQGGVKLNGSSLIQESERDIKKLEDELLKELEEPATITTY